MGNSWSFLYDELNMSNQDNWVDSDLPGPFAAEEVSFDLYGGAAQDTISFEFEPGSSAPPIVLGGEDRIEFKETKKQNINRRKYNEDAIIKELTEYITSTYNQHYSSDQIQTLDLIESCGDGEAFCRSNILKYASRYDRKGTARRDIMKIMHYAVLLMYFNDKNTTTETYNQ